MKHSQMIRDIGLMIMRLTVGGLFIAAGVIKLGQPVEEFILAIQQYQLLPEAIIPVFATILPFTEVIFGTFLILGLFTRISSVVVGLELVSFIIALSWVLAKGIQLNDCGCFGEEVPFLSVPTGELLVRDIILLVFTGIIFSLKPSRWSLDTLLKK